MHKITALIVPLSVTATIIHLFLCPQGCFNKTACGLFIAITFVIDFDLLCHSFVNYIFKKMAK